MGHVWMLEKLGHIWLLAFSKHSIDKNGTNIHSSWNRQKNQDAIHEYSMNVQWTKSTSLKNSICVWIFVHVLNKYGKSFDIVELPKKNIYKYKTNKYGKYFDEIDLPITATASISTFPAFGRAAT